MIYLNKLNALNESSNYDSADFSIFDEKIEEKKYDLNEYRKSINVVKDSLRSAIVTICETLDDNRIKYKVNPLEFEDIYREEDEKYGSERYIMTIVCDRDILEDEEVADEIESIMGYQDRDNFVYSSFVGNIIKIEANVYEFGSIA